MFCFRRVTSNIYRQFTIQYRSLESFSSTIYALSTNIKNTGSAIAVVRVAGPDTLQVINKLTHGKAPYYQNNPRKAILQNLYTVDDLEIIDKAMLIWFPKPKSYTGEDMCEFHIHGSQAVIAKLLTTLGQINGCRAAKEGEFTKKALINGKVQLIEAEGIRDLIHAKTDVQRRRALSVISEDVLGSKFNDWRQQIISYMAHLDAYIDFSEDELIDEDVINNLKQNINSLQKQIKQHLDKSRQKSDLIKDGIRIAIVGDANVGKSSLINRLCERDVSIVSDTSGTTRDIVESWLDINGYSVCIADTAGIKNLNDHQIEYVEREGIKKAIERAKQCHLVIFVVDASSILPGDQYNLPNYLHELIQCRDDQNLMFVVNKIDLLEEKPQHLKIDNKEDNIHLVSCRNGDGFSQFFNSFGRKIENLCGNPNEEILFNNKRHLVHFEKTLQELAQVIVSIGVDFALAASHLRQAAYQLECLTGKITTDDVLDVIFKDFCIGK